MIRTAVFDASERYRYRLDRRWSQGSGRVVFVMLNPSTADAERDDPTIRRCMGFAADWGHRGLTVVNLFAWRATKPKELTLAEDPIGEDNDLHLRSAIQRSQRIVLAWGNHGRLNDRWRDVVALLGRRRELFCLGKTKLGQPRHPLYVRRDFEALPFVIDA
jgi:hypothetical protein